MALKRQHIIWLAWIIFAMTCMHAYFDVTTSSQGGVVGADRTAVHTLVISITILEGIYVFFKSFRNNAVSYISRPLFAIGIWMVISNLINDRPVSITLFYLVFIVWWIVTIRFYAIYTEANYVQYRTIFSFFIVLFFIWIWLNIVARSSIQNIYSKYGITMFIYNIVLLIPFIFFIKSNFRRNLCIVLACFMVILSLKRGAIVTLPIMIFAYYIAKYKIENRTMKILLPIVIFGILLLVILLYMNDATNGLLFNRFDTQELQSGSGRSELRETAMGEISQREFLAFLVGSGGGSSVELLGTGVHNEWIESFFTYGIIGLLLYGWMAFRLIKYTFKLIRLRNNYAPYLAMYCAYLVMCTMFSGFLYMHVAFYFWAGVGFFIGMISYHNKRAIAI